MTAAPSQKRSLTREQLQQWGVLTLMVVLFIGIVLFMFLALLPDLKRRTEYNTVLTSVESELRVAQIAKAEAPGEMQNQLDEAQKRLTEAANAFLTDAESTIIVNRLYTYADEASVEIVNLQAAPAIVADTHEQRDYQFRVAGQTRSLLGFLGRIKEVAIPGFVVNKVAIIPDPEAPTGAERHLLTMNVSVASSPYSTRLAEGPTQNLENFANIGDLPLAEVQRQVELAWTGRKWDQAIRLLDQVVATSPENETARIVLYRAHVNYGYHYMSERNDAAGKAEFEAALAVQPDGHEAIVELQQIAADSTLSYSVEDQLRQELEQAKAAGNWQEVIRLLRIISAVDARYGPVDAELNQAYINYGNQLAVAGEMTRAEEQYQMANYASPNQTAPVEVAVAAALPLTGTTSSPAVDSAQTPPLSSPSSSQTLPTPMPTPLPTETATPSPTLSPTLPPTLPPTETPLPTPTETPIPTSSPTSTSTATVEPTSTPVPVSTMTATPTSTAMGSIPSPTQVQPTTATYVVQAGDTLYSIARRFGTTIEALRAANGLNSNDIRTGQVLFIVPSSLQPPSPGIIEHTVAPNDTLYSIAQRYGTTVEAIMQANGLNSSRINVGQQLLIPVPISIVPLATPHVVAIKTQV